MPQLTKPAKAPAIDRRPVHPSITAKQIFTLVENFYARVRDDKTLGPIFNKRLEGEWEPHLDKMKCFWRSVLLRTGEYKGQPVPIHLRLKEARSEDFQVWLSLFRETVAEIFEPDAAPLVIAAAERIAQSLWLAMFSGPMDAPPQWMRQAMPQASV